MRENCVVPTALEIFFPAYPALKRWENSFAPAALVYSCANCGFIPPRFLKLSSHVNTAGRPLQDLIRA